MPKAEKLVRKFSFQGDGLGIAGLPHEVTEEEARALGVWDTLQAALKNGSYLEITAKPAEENKS